MNRAKAAGRWQGSLAEAVAVLASLLLAACKPGFNAPPSPELADKLEAPYDYYINGMKSWRFTTEGMTVYQLTADHVTHYPFDDHTDLEKPVLHWQRQNAAPWVITADTSSVVHLNQADEITLNGNVHGSSTQATGPLAVMTPTLTIRTGAKTADTAAVAEMTTPASRLRGTGMHVDLSNNTISLLKDVRGTHAP